MDGIKKKEFKTHILEERISRTCLKIKRLLRHYAHTVSNVILELAIKNGVKKIYIGDAIKNKNKESKLNKEDLEYKAKECGIEVEYISELFTSGVDSSVDGTVSKENYMPEARIKRGLFKSKLLGLLNADVNACRNFLKRLGKFDLISGVSRPVRLRVFHKLKVAPLLQCIVG